MKTSVLWTLAFIFMLPFIARSQQVENKTSADRQSQGTTALHPKVTQEMAMLQAENKGGGGAGEAGVPEETGMYLEPGWMPGYVVLQDQSMLEDVQLRYDIYNQQFQFIRKLDTLAFANPHELAHIQIGDHRFIYSSYQVKETSGVGYFEVITGGDCQLLARHKIAYHLESGSRPRLEQDLYVRECEYYVKKGKLSAQPVRACKKSVMCAFRDKEEEIRSFLDDNKLKMKTCDELKQVVAFYNSLSK